MAPSGNVTDGAEPRPEELFAKGWTVSAKGEKKRLTIKNTKTHQWRTCQPLDNISANSGGKELLLAEPEENISRNDRRDRRENDYK